MRAAGFEAKRYSRAPEPAVDRSFEANPERFTVPAAGLELAADVREVLDDERPDLLVADCMLPAALAAGESAGTPTASVVHFPYGLARSVLSRGAGAWTTDRAVLDETRGALGLPPTPSDLAAWESPQLLLVTLPRWFDAPIDYPAHVVHAGPIGIRTGRGARRLANSRPRALLSFSTTVIDGQSDLVRHACAALEPAGVDGLLTLGPALEPVMETRLRGVELIDWADHDALLPDVDMVVTHGGLGTTLRSLAHGKPLLVLPLGRDQLFNAQRVAELEVGIHLPANAPPERISEALTRLVSHLGFRDAARQAAARIAAERPDRTAAEALARTAATR
jgi:UDP:flavonoid glycosyltransferase YjiC (YdhE family)